MSMIIGVTGLIGSGKSVVLKTLSKLYDIPYYDSDTHAKDLYFDPIVRDKIRAQLGFDPIALDGTLNKPKLREVLDSEYERKLLEQINHEAVQRHFEEWSRASGSEIVALESAILFTSGFSELCDLTVSVYADKEIRRARVLARDNGRSQEDFKRIELIQVTEARRQQEEADIIIENNGTSSIIRAVEALWERINKLKKEKYNEAN